MFLPVVGGWNVLPRRGTIQHPPGKIRQPSFELFWVCEHYNKPCRVLFSKLKTLCWGRMRCHTTKALHSMGLQWCHVGIGYLGAIRTQRGLIYSRLTERKLVSATRRLNRNRPVVVVVTGCGIVRGLPFLAVQHAVERPFAHRSQGTFTKLFQECNTSKSKPLKLLPFLIKYIQYSTLSRVKNLSIASL